MKLIVTVVMGMVLGSVGWAQQQLQQVQLPKHLEARPRVDLVGQVTGTTGTNLVVTTTTNVPVFSPARVEVYRDRNNRVAKRTIPGQQIGTREVKETVVVANYANWKKAKVGDSVRFKVVHVTVTGGKKLALYAGPAQVRSTGTVLD